MKKFLGQAFMACALLACCGTFFASCGADDDDEYVVTTNEASDVTTSRATVTGTVSQDLLTNGSVDYFGVRYGEDEEADDDYETTDDITGTTFSITLSGLSSGTTYYYKAFVRTDNGNYIYGSTRKFTTTKVDTDVSSGKAVNLGLPSGTKWASRNVGADSPEDYGDYFAWGETSPKDEYTEGNSVTYGLGYSTLKSKGITDSDGNLTAKYDAATANWGKNWHMPTLTQIQELVKSCTWTWTAQNGVYGRLVTGPNGNSIFLPAAGYRYGTSLNDAGSYGSYWGSTASEDYSSYACYLSFDSGKYGWGNLDYRYYGRSVRPVSE